MSKLITLTIAITHNALIESDLQTHDNSYADVARGLSLARDEITRVFNDRKQCPYYPKNAEDANRPIARHNLITGDPNHVPATRAMRYYEAHITIDPVAGDVRWSVEAAGQQHGFKLAKLLMDKGVPSQLDTFMTGHGLDLEDMKQRVQDMCRALYDLGCRVRRYKIEDTVLDSRQNDVWMLVNSNAPSKPPTRF